MSKNNKKVNKVPKHIQDLLKDYNQGIKLDIGCGERKNDGFIGMDIRPMKGVDIVWNLERFPYPLPDESVSLAVASHVLEHINPGNESPRLVGLIELLRAKKLITDAEIAQYIGKYDVFGVFVTFMDEIWRILKPKGQFAFIVPYAGSFGYWQDPTHINPINEATLGYFDPLHESQLWHIYKPKPWEIKESHAQVNGFFEVVLEKRIMDKSYEVK